MSLVEALLAWRETVPVTIKDVLVGFSGGCDSQVLLHGLYQCEQIASRFSLQAIHIHHGLHPKADAWVKHCQTHAEQWGVPLTVVKLALVPSLGESVENVAREARYRAFLAALKPNAMLLTAHHLEDQAETILLQLLRGAGVKGLSGMPFIKPLGQGWHARPLLAISRDVIAAYAKEQALSWVEDSSNEEVRFTRNYLRHRVMPLLKEINPNYAACFARSAGHCQTTQNLLEDYLSQDLKACMSDDCGIVIDKLKAHTRLHQEAMVRLWLQSLGTILPSSKKLRTMVQQMVEARCDAHPCVEWGDWQVMRRKGIMRVSKRIKYGNIVIRENSC